MREPAAPFQGTPGIRQGRVREGACRTRRAEAARRDGYLWLVASVEPSGVPQAFSSRNLPWESASTSNG